MRFALLASGSKGNAALVEYQDHLILVDCGLSYKQTKLRMDQLGASPSDLTAIFITHEHSDHIKGLPMLCKNTGKTPHMTNGTAHALELGKNDYVEIRVDKGVILTTKQGAQVTVKPYALPHDAHEPVNYKFTCEGSTLTFATDLGIPSDYVVEQLLDSNALVLECNYDPVMLEGNLNYPPSLKNRIRGVKGHLSNEQAGELLLKIIAPKLRTVVAAHISQKNNFPDKATEALSLALINSGYSPNLIASNQDVPTQWIEISLES